MLPPPPETSSDVFRRPCAASLVPWRPFKAKNLKWPFWFLWGNPSSSTVRWWMVARGAQPSLEFIPPLRYAFEGKLVFISRQKWPQNCSKTPFEGSYLRVTEWQFLQRSCHFRWLSSQSWCLQWCPAHRLRTCYWRCQQLGIANVFLCTDFEKRFSLGPQPWEWQLQTVWLIQKSGRRFFGRITESEVGTMAEWRLGAQVFRLSMPTLQWIFKASKQVPF